MEEKLIIENINSFKEQIEKDKKTMKVGGAITGGSIIGFIFMILKVIDELNISHTFKSFSFILYSVFSGIWAIIGSVGIGITIDGLINYLKDNNNLKNEELKLTK